MSTTKPRIENPETEKIEWLSRLNDLFLLVEGWVEESGWRTRRTTKPVTEAALGRYEVPLLLMERGGVEIVLSPIARTSADSDRVVDLYLMPGYDDVASLHFEGGRWRVRHASPFDPAAPRTVAEGERLPLEEATTNRILDAVAAHAQPSKPRSA